MYEPVKGLLLALLKVPPEPVDPMGDVRSLRVFRAAPGYLRYLMLGWSISQLAVLVAASIAFGSALVGATAASSSATPVAIVYVLGAVAVVVLLVQACLTFFSLRLNYEMRWYKVTDRSLRIRSGIWNVHEMTMTFANVQNINVTQGPLERLFGISDVRVESAGGGAKVTAHGKGPSGDSDNLHLAVFRGVDNPEEIRNLMLQRLQRARDAGLGDPDDARTRREGHADGVTSAETRQVCAALRDEAKALRAAMSRQAG
jgi:membrane protein YdbS with pleckstrin-like domain